MNKVLIGLSTGEYIRKAEFLPYFLGIDKPEGTLMTTVHGQSPASARNIIIQQALDNKCSHVLLVDDDMATPADTLTKLLAHDVDVVTALYLHRNYPHFPVVFDRAFSNGFNKYQYLDENAEGLMKITNCGLGCVLIKTSIFENLEKPWVRLGEIEKDGWCDDVGFFNRVREAGFELYCDFDTRVGHMSSMVLWPNKLNDKWYTEYKNQNGNVLVPQVIPTKEELEQDIERKQLMPLASG